MKNPLSEKQELLIMRYYDGEVSFLEKYRAKSLLSNNSEAEAFWMVLDEAARGSRIVIEERSETAGEVDLWSRIERRIEQEERAEFFLGRRELEQDTRSRHSFFDAFFAKGFASGFAGAAAAVFLGLMVLPGSIQTLSVPAQSAVIRQTGTPIVLRDMNASTEAAVNLASGNSSNYGVSAGVNSGVPGSLNVPAPRFLESAAQGVDEDYVEPRIIESRPVEVDWMRSDGRVRMVHDPSESSPIIWVKRRLPLPTKKVQIYRSKDGKRVLVVEKAIPSETLVPGR